MAPKIGWVALGTLCVAGLVVVGWPRDEAGPELPGPGPAAEAAKPDPVRPSAPSTRKRIATTAPSRRPELTVAGDFTAKRTALAVRVVDLQDRPVAGAVVEAWGGNQLLPRRLSRRRSAGPLVVRPRGGPRASAATDAGGRCGIELEAGIGYVEAHEESVGRGRQWTVSPLSGSDPLPDGGELTIVLRPTVMVSGTVLYHDGRPAVGADVTVKLEPGPVSPAPPEPRPTDDTGRFAIEMEWVASCTLVAAEGRDRTDPAKLRWTAPEDRDVVLRFPGTYTIAGRVVQPGGQLATRGRVSVWEQPQDGSEAPGRFTETARAEPDGTFAVEVRRAGAYALVARATRFGNSVIRVVEVSDAQPRVEVVLQLIPAGDVTGVVKLVSGDAVRGAIVSLAAEPPTVPGVTRIRTTGIFARVAPVRTRAGGKFRFRGVDPGTTYKLRCVPNSRRPHIAITRPGIRVGQHVVLSLREDEVRGATLELLVVSADPDEPAETVSVVTLSYRDGRPQRGSNLGRFDVHDGRVAVDGLPVAREIGLLVAVRNYAPVFLGPLDTVAPRGGHVVRFQRYGKLRCRVVDRAGEPVAKATVRAWRVPAIPGRWGSVHAITGADGAALLDVAPGGCQVLAARNRGSGVDLLMRSGAARAGARELDIAAGRLHEITFELDR